MANRDLTNSDLSETALMIVYEFVADLRGRGMELWAEAEHVVIEPDALTEADVAAIVANKPAILACLRAEAALSSQTPTGPETKHDQHVNNHDNETACRGLMGRELSRTVAEMLRTFPGAQLVGLAPNPRLGESWIELDGEKQPRTPSQPPADPQLPDRQLPLGLKGKSVITARSE